MIQRFGILILALWLSAMLVGCGGVAPSGQPAPTPGGIVVTVRVADAEEYRIRLTDPDDIGIAQKLLAGESAPRIPNGRVVRDAPDVNVGYSWHIDPDSVEFADTATEVCDGRPSFGCREARDYIRPILSLVGKSRGDRASGISVRCWWRWRA